MTNINIDKIQMKRGNRATIPVLDDGEPAICLDTKEFAIGTPDGNLYFSFQDLTDLVNEVGNAKGGYASLQEKLSSLASSGGGSGDLTYNTLADLQAAYPNGTTKPAWVVTDNAWYYWSGTITGDTTAPTVTISPAAGTYNTSKSITLTANETATIYYTTDGSTPTTASTVYSVPISISATTTLKYFAKDTAGNSSTPQTAVFTIDAVAPTLTITAGGTFTGTKSVTMSVNETADIYYTLDGSTPTTSNTKYTSPLSISATTTLKAFAKDTAGNSSAVQTVTYTLDATPPADTTAPNNVTNLAYSNVAQTSLTLTWTASASSDVASYDVYNGSTLLANVTGTTYNVSGLTASTQYTFTVKAKDAANNVASGASATVTTSAPADTTAPTVTASPAAGTYTSAQSVTLTANETATIYYTTNGTTPTTASTVYTGPISISATTTLQFIAKDAAGNTNAPVAATYTINLLSGVVDSFNRTSSTTLGTANTGQTWESLSGTWGTDGSSAYLVSSSGGTAVQGGYMAVIDAGVGKSDATCQVTFNVTALNQRMAFRVTDASNFWLVNVDAGNKYALYKMVAGSFVSVQTSNLVAANGDVVKVVTSGTNINVLVNNNSIMTTSDSFNQNATKYGLTSTNNQTFRWDDFSVQ